MDVEIQSKVIANIEKMQENFCAARGELKISRETEDVLSTSFELVVYIFPTKILLLFRYFWTRFRRQEHSVWDAEPC